MDTNEQQFDSEFELVKQQKQCANTATVNTPDKVQALIEAGNAMEQSIKGVALESFDVELDELISVIDLWTEARNGYFKSLD